MRLKRLDYLQSTYHIVGSESFRQTRHFTFAYTSSTYLPAFVQNLV